MDSVTIAVYDAALNLECDTTWGHTGGDYNSEDTSADGSYSFFFVTGDAEEFTVYARGWYGGDLYPTTYTKWPGHNIIAISDDTIAAQYAEYFYDGTGATQGVELSAKQLHLECDSASSDTAFLADGGKLVGGRGIYAAGAWGITGIARGANSGHGIYALGVGASGAGIRAASVDGYRGIFAVGSGGAGAVGFYADGVKYGMYLEGDSSDFGGEYDTPNFTAAVATEFQGSASLTADQVAVAVWDKDTTGRGPAGSFGGWLKDSLDGAISNVSANITASDITDIAHRVWNDTSSQHITAGTFGAYLDQAVSDNATPAEVAAQVLAVIQDWADTAYVSVDSISDSLITAAKIKDSTLTVSKIKSYAFTEAKFGTGAISARVVGGDAIGASELAGTAAKEIADSVGTVTTDTTAILALVQGHPSDFIGTAGSGAYEDTIYVIDTSGTDAAVSGVTVAVYNQSGVKQGTSRTNSSGYATFNLDAGTWDVTGTATMYQFPTGQEITTASHQSDSIFGYDFSVTAPTGCSTCTVYGFIYNILGQAVEGSEVYVSLPGQTNLDTCCDVILSGFEKSTTTNSSGKFELEVPRSSCIQGNTYYRFRATHPNGYTIMSVTDSIPDSSTYKLTW